MQKEITKNQIEQIFLKAGIGDINSIQKIDIGFSNDVYSVDDKYILKIGRSPKYEEFNKKDIYICNLFESQMPTPQILYSDESKKLIDNVFFIYPKIQGDNLYDKWHLFDNNERKQIVEQICSILKKINKTPYGDFAKKFSIDTNVDWKTNMISRIKDLVEKTRSAKSLDTNTANAIYSFIEKHKDVLQEQKLALTYWDLHFDNLLVSNDKIVGILDFERMEVSSIDYTLVLVSRMIKNPKKYASKNAEQFIEKEDYSELLDWYKSFIQNYLILKI